MEEERARPSGKAAAGKGLDPDQVSRIRAVARKLAGVLTLGDAQWLDHIAQGHDPEHSIRTWELAAASYRSFTRDRPLSSDAHDNVLRMALDKASGVPDEQLLARPSDHLSVADRTAFLEHHRTAASTLGFTTAE